MIAKITAVAALMARHAKELHSVCLVVLCTLQCSSVCLESLAIRATAVRTEFANSSDIALCDTAVTTEHWLEESDS
jgi:hypothetical protein